LNRSGIVRFYADAAKRPKAKDLANIISRSVDRLITKEMLVGYGKKTATKWFVETVKLTARGRGAARKMLGEQQVLPLKVKIQNPKGKSTSQK